MNNPENQTALYELTLAENKHIGFAPRKQSEDRSIAQYIETQAGMAFYVAMIVDGFGGLIDGKPAGQFVIDKVLAYIQNSNDLDVYAVLKSALQNVHQTIQKLGSTNIRLRSAGATATLAAINASTLELYLAHAGNNRAYLIQKRNILALTLDNALPVEPARPARPGQEPEKTTSELEIPSSYIGKQGVAAINIDVGVRLEDGQLYPEPVLLQPGDTLFLCTDGLVGNIPQTVDHFVEPDEIGALVVKYPPEEAVEQIVQLALSRQVQDNCLAMILEVPGRRRSTFPILPVGFGAIILVALFLAGAYLFLSRPSQPVSTPTLTRIPPTATATLDITAGNAEIQEFEDKQLRVEISGGSIGFSTGSKIPFGAQVRVRTGFAPARLKLSDGSLIFLEESTVLYLQQIAPASPITTLALEQGGVLVVATQLRVQPTNGLYQADCDHCVMGVRYEMGADNFQVDCLGSNFIGLPGGACHLKSQTSSQELITGQRGGFTRLEQSHPEGAQYDAWMLIGKANVPTPSPTPTFTVTLTPTNTATPRPPTQAPNEPGGGTPGGPKKTSGPKPQNPTATPPDSGGG